ncbi:MAG: GNVR domain-containing protein [Pseudomonadota bacterium]
MSTLMPVMDTRPAPAADDGKVDLGLFLATLKRARVLIGACVVAALILAVAYLWITPPTFRADVLLQVERKANAVETLLNESTRPLEETESISAELELMRSRQVLGEVIDRLKLEIIAEPHYFPVIGTAFKYHGSLDPDGTLFATPWRKLARYAWGGEVIALSTLEVPPMYVDQPLLLTAGRYGQYTLQGPEGELLLTGDVDARAAAGGFISQVDELIARPGTQFKVMRLSRMSALTALQKRLDSKEQGKLSGIINLSVYHEDAARAVEIANAMALAYLEQDVSRRAREAKQTMTFIDSQLPLVRERLKTAEDNYNRYRLARGSADLDLEIKGRLERQLEVENQLVDIQRQRAVLRESFAPLHPKILALDGQETRLTQEVGTLDRWIKNLPETQRNLTRLMRDVQINTQLYLSLLNSSQEQGIAQAGNIGNSRIVDPALLPSEPVKPRPDLVIALSVALGLFVGMAATLLRHVLRQLVSDPRWIEQHFGLPVFAVIPHSKSEQRLRRYQRRPRSVQRLLAHRSPQDAAIESLLVLPHTMQLTAARTASPEQAGWPPEPGRGQVLLICGPRAGVGKSFVSANLAALLARTHRVLLVDADLRHGRLHDYFGLPPTPGLTEMIARGAHITPHRVTDNLHVLRSGLHARQPAALLQSATLSQHTAAWAAQYDYVLFDSAPLLEVADTLALAPLADVCLLVLKAHAHSLVEIDLSLKRMLRAGGKVQGVLFNDVSPADMTYYTRAYGYAS